MQFNIQFVTNSLDSSALRDILQQDAALNREMQEALFDSMRDLTKSVERPVGTPAPLEGPKPVCGKSFAEVSYAELEYGFGSVAYRSPYAGPGT